ncbi:ester cyclase [Nocardia sp. R7R-8]|uniref:ester cyclase n=1 Tax=Nocardia sp. R7R-8 TaxID=3459304 RepID=UPI00403DA223
MSGAETEDANKKFMARLGEELASTDDVAAVLRRHLHPDFVRHSSSGQLDRDEWIRTYGTLLAAFPDMVMNTEVTVTERDWLVSKWTATGHHTGAYFGVPPTGKLVNAIGITMTRFTDGLIVEEHSSWNKADVLHTLGIIPISELG